MTECASPETLAPDRAKWPSGPWDHEPDKIQWKTASGLPGLIVRSSLGALCGYAAVPPSHPYWGHYYDDVPVSVHGGLTYGAQCDGSICHVPEPGEPDDVFWFGFDCSHSGDMVPGILALDKKLGLRGFAEAFGTSSEYRDVAYVRAQVERLAIQLKELS
jgi:hypothetical protein